jgi:hypothetical protein
MQPQGLIGMRGSMRPPGKSGLTFDHILSGLSNELQKSRDTANELHSLNGSMNEIHDALGGTLVRNPTSGVSPFLMFLLSPPTSPYAPNPSLRLCPHNLPWTFHIIGELQSQLRDTRSSLPNYADKFNLLVNDHDGFKHDIELFRCLWRSVSERPKPENDIKMVNFQLTTMAPDSASLRCPA